MTTDQRLLAEDDNMAQLIKLSCKVPLAFLIEKCSIARLDASSPEAKATYRDMANGLADVLTAIRDLAKMTEEAAHDHPSHETLGASYRKQRAQ